MALAEALWVYDSATNSYFPPGSPPSLEVCKQLSTYLPSKLNCHYCVSIGLSENSSIDTPLVWCFNIHQIQNGRIYIGSKKDIATSVIDHS
jgi:hypothetical protein